MAVGAHATKLHLSTAAAMRPSPLHLAAVAVLCSVSYLLGIWHNGGFSPVPLGGAASSVYIATAAFVSCASPTPNVLGGGGGSSSAPRPRRSTSPRTTPRRGWRRSPRAAQVTDKAMAVGFGISTPDYVRQIAEWGADGVIIGSAMVRQLGEAASPNEGSGAD